MADPMVVRFCCAMRSHLCTGYAFHALNAQSRKAIVRRSPAPPVVQSIRKPSGDKANRKVIGVKQAKQQEQNLRPEAIIGRLV
jgi:hypothetical protein